MNELVLPPEISRQLAELYYEMQEAYDRIAGELVFSCAGCPDNCCDSYFLHHTYIEWAYLWEGLNKEPEDVRKRIIKRAEEYVRQSEHVLARGERPQIMCPLNEEGLCALYSHRLLICRLHGVPAEITRPDGRKQHFPGCFRCQELTENNADIPAMDRTDFFRRMVELEVALLGARRRTAAKVKKTLAQMLVQGPPVF